MIRYRPRLQGLAVALAGLAGFVDAVGFLKLGGLFVSFMSGNSTRLAVSLAANAGIASVAAGLIACFVAGVVAATIAAGLSRFSPRRAVLGLATLLLALAAAWDTLAGGSWSVYPMAAAMGAANVTLQRDGEVAVGVTYMTGALVKFGQRLAAALTGGDRLAWLPYLLLWLGLVSGAVLGSLAFQALGSAAIWVAVAAALALTGAASRLEDAAR